MTLDGKGLRAHELLGFGHILRSTTEDFWQPPYHFKAHLLPQGHGRFVGAHHDVELHGQVARGAGLGERVLAHRPADPEIPVGGAHQVARIGHVGSPAGLVGADEVGAGHFAGHVGHVSGARRGHPIQAAFLLGEIFGVGECLTRGDLGVKQRPDSRKIPLLRAPDLEQFGPGTRIASGHAALRRYRAGERRRYSLRYR